MNDRRKFLQQIGFTAGALAIPSLFEPLFANGGQARLERVSGMSPELAATDEDFGIGYGNNITLRLQL